MFRVNLEENKFERFNHLLIELDANDVINFCEFDQSFDHIFIVHNRSILEKRAITDLQTVSLSIELEEQIGDSVSKLLDISNDGKWCVIGAGGIDLDFFYLIDIMNGLQTKLKSRRCKGMYAPCFINGDSQRIAIGGTNGHGVEIWDVAKKVCHVISH